MTDIIERLRHKIPLTIADIREAAAEIERLRALQPSEPCGECHLQPGETCDICGAAQPSGQTRAEMEAQGKQSTGMWPDWGDRPDGFDGPGGAE